METAAQTFARDLAKLFQEYADKLHRLLDEVHNAKATVRDRKKEWRTSGEQREFKSRFAPMQSALQTATREASQLAEQGGVDDPARIELRVRLAEVEGLTVAVMSSINNPE